MRNEKNMFLSDLHTVLTWFSPSYPIGSYAYSHGLEYAVEEGLVKDPQTLLVWIRDLLFFGTGYNDSIIINSIYDSVANDNCVEFDYISQIANAIKPTKEIALESYQQGVSFKNILMDVYSNSNLTFYLNRLDDCITYPSVVGVAGGIFEVEKKLLLHSYLHAFTSNILSAALRIMPIGQTEIQKIIFQMKGNVEEMTNKSLGLSLSDLGSSVFISDWASSKHQNQYTRLFRS
ncbi:MAG: urease accessory protein UreF [Rhizobiales bacterium]|nr:urease accessory protein UreF [Hyphomicrobiales bacterium]